MKFVNDILSKLKSKHKSESNSETFIVEEFKILDASLPLEFKYISPFEFFLEKFDGLEKISEYLYHYPGTFIKLIQSLNLNMYSLILKYENIYHHFNSYICKCAICYKESIDTRMYFPYKTAIDSCQESLKISFLRRQYQQFKYSTRLMIKRKDNNSNNNSNSIIISLLDCFLELEYKVLLSSWIGDSHSHNHPNDTKIISIKDNNIPIYNPFEYQNGIFINRKKWKKMKLNFHLINNLHNAFNNSKFSCNSQEHKSLNTYLQVIKYLEDLLLSIGQDRKYLYIDNPKIHWFCTSMFDMDGFKCLVIVLLIFSVINDNEKEISNEETKIEDVNYNYQIAKISSISINKTESKKTWLKLFNNRIPIIV